MDVPRFTTYADLDALREFFLGTPPLTQPEALRDWSEAWGFLTTETDLAFDVHSDEIEAGLRSNDPLVCALLHAGTMRRFGSDMAPKVTHPWRMHVERTPKRRSGMLSLDAPRIGPVIRRLRTARSVAFRQGKELPAALEAFRTPTCGLILVDPYLLSAGASGLRESVAPLLASLLPEDPGRVPVLVVCGTVERDRKGAVLPGVCPYLSRKFGGDVRRAQRDLQDALRALRGPEVSVSLVVHGQALKDYHDRHLFSRYFEMHTSRSVDRLTRRGAAQFDASLDGFSVLDPAQRPMTLDLLRKVKDIVDGADAHPDARLDGAARHPLFALLNEA